MPELHPLNTGFEWQTAASIPRCAASIRPLPADSAEHFDSQGYLLYEGAFDAETMARAIAEIDPIEAKVEAFLRTREGGKLFIAKADAITFSTHLVQRSDFLRELSASQPILELCAALVGPDVRLYWDQAVYKKPGNPEEFPWHQDNGYTYIEPQQYLTCWVALTDVDEQNGCPWVIPGSHRRGTLRHETTDLGFQCAEHPADAIPVPARAGDIVVFSSLTPHRTGPNATAEVRKSYILQYAPEGARSVAQRGQPAGPLDDPGRQYLVLQRGEAVSLPEA